MSMSVWVKITMYCLGLPARSRDRDNPASTTGFDTETLAPSRQPSLSERLITAATTLLLTSAAALVFFHAGWRDITDGRRAWIYGGAGALWGLRMLLPPRLPMDRTAIGLGAYTFLPWLPSLVFRRKGTLMDFAGPNLSAADLDWLGWHAAGFLVLVSVGIALDIRAEMRAKEPRS